MIIKEILVDLGDNSYKICIGARILEKIGNRLRNVDIGDKCVIITNPIINQLYGDKVVKSLKKNNFRTVVLEVPDGEEHKSLEDTKILYDKLLANNVDRKSCIVALGGGVIGDLAGFVAATYARGIPFVQVPTTLLAQVDSSVGGKVAVNRPAVKNGIGAFYQPKLVWIDIDTLGTLPDREFKSGIAEVIKYAMIADSKLFYYLKRNVSKLKQHDKKVLFHIISESCKIKKDIVEQDEKENNLRMILNYGHTFGHAIENISNYQLRHGEAVALGMICAAEVSEKIGELNKEIADEQENLIHLVGLNTSIKHKTTTKEIIEKMEHDKKKIDDKLRLVLPKSIGMVTIKDDVSKKTLRTVLKKRLIASSANKNKERKQLDVTKKSRFNICVCISENNQKEVLNSIKKAVQNGAGLVELRLDLIKNNLDLKEIIKGCKVPVIITDRKNKENLIQGIEAGCDYIDIELEIDNKIRDEIVKKAKKHGCKVIISMHDYHMTPSYSKLLQVMHQEKNAGADIGKIVTMANSIEDCQILLDLSIEAKKIGFPILSFAMGDIGRFTRVIAPMIGSKFIYASIKDEVEPGQFSISNLNSIYKELTL